jgi:very-short-patch-repair endonuclease
VHTARRAFEHDRRRDQRLMLLGWRVVRFTWRQVLFEPAYVAATLGGLLAA